VGSLKGIKLISDLLKLLRFWIMNLLKLLLLFMLILQYFSMLILLVVQILMKFLVLLVSKLKAIASVISEFLDKQKSLNRFCLNLTVVVLENLKVISEVGKLIIKKLSQKLNILSLWWIRIKSSFDVLHSYKIHLCSLSHCNFGITNLIRIWSVFCVWNCCSLLFLYDSSGTLLLNITYSSHFIVGCSLILISSHIPDWIHKCRLSCTSWSLSCLGCCGNSGILRRWLLSGGSLIRRFQCVGSCLLSNFSLWWGHNWRRGHYWRCCHLL